MTLYETIFARRQVRRFDENPLDQQLLDEILKCVLDTDQFDGLQAQFEIVSNDAVNGGAAPHYLLSYCEDNIAAYANVGYVMQNVDLYIQSIGLGCGWFMGVQPKENNRNYCITLAFGNTDTPLRKSSAEFKRLPLRKISTVDNAVAKAVRLAPSALNSQPWKLEFSDGKVVIKDIGRGVVRVMLRNKLNKIDVGIATRYAVIALEQEGKKTTSIIPKSVGKEFEMEILYQ